MFGYDYAKFHEEMFNRFCLMTCIGFDIGMYIFRKMREANEIKFVSLPSAEAMLDSIICYW